MPGPDAAWRIKPSWYLIATRDRMIPALPQRREDGHDVPPARVGGQARMPWSPTGSGMGGRTSSANPGRSGGRAGLGGRL